MKWNVLLALVLSYSLLAVSNIFGQCCAPPPPPYPCLKINPTNDGFNYQTVVRDNNGNVLKNKNLTLEITLNLNCKHESYIEAFRTITTNNFGLVNLTIGKGDSIISGKFDTIDWSHEYIICVYVDTASGSNFHLMGCSPLASVPYAMYAKNSGNSKGGWHAMAGVSTGTGIQYLLCLGSGALSPCDGGA